MTIEINIQQQQQKNNGFTSMSRCFNFQNGVYSVTLMRSSPSAGMFCFKSVGNYCFFHVVECAENPNCFLYLTSIVNTYPLSWLLWEFQIFLDGRNEYCRFLKRNRIFQPQSGIGNQSKKDIRFHVAAKHHQSKKAFVATSDYKWFD